MKKRVSLLSTLIIIIGGGIIAALWLLPQLRPLTLVSLDTIHWDQPPGLIAVEDMEREGRSGGTLLVRLKDGKEQFAYEGWDVTFSDYGSVFSFQKKFIPPKDDPHMLYYIEDGERVIKLTIENSGGYIKDVAENPSRTYLFAEFVIGDTSSFCILERVASSSANIGDKPCLQLDIPHVESGAWNPSHERELIVKTTAGLVFALDPWEKRPRQIYREGDTAQKYATVNALFDAPQTPDSSSYTDTITKRIIRLPFATIIRDEGWVILPGLGDLQLAWIDSDHLLAKNNDSIEIIEYKTGAAAMVLHEKDIANKSLRIHSQNRDITL